MLRELKRVTKSSGLTAEQESQWVVRQDQKEPYAISAVLVQASLSTCVTLNLSIVIYHRHCKDQKKICGNPISQHLTASMQCEYPTLTPH